MYSHSTSTITRRIIFDELVTDLDLGLTQTKTSKSPFTMGNPKKVSDPSSDPVDPQPTFNTSNYDSVYGQAQARPADNKNPSHRQPATGDPIGLDDAVYPQSQKTSNKPDVDRSDPVYGQPATANPASGPTHMFPATGDPIGHDDAVYPQQKRANTRLQQLTSHVAPTPTETNLPEAANTKTTRRKPKPETTSHDLPTDYADILSQLQRIRQHTATPDTSSRGYHRQLTAGKLWARERISQLLDQHTWHEIGGASGLTTWRTDTQNPQAEHISSFTPLNNPQGFGVVTIPRVGMKRRVYLTADDFTIRAGHADGGNSLKTLYGEKLALKLKVPVIKLVDGSSGGGSVSTIAKMGWSYIPHNTYLSVAAEQLNAGIPNLGAVLGPAIGLGAARVVCSHFSVMAGDVGSLFNAGPKVVEGATFEEDLSFQDLGGPGVHCTNGTIDNLAANEKECFEQIRTVLGYLPDYGGIAPPVVECGDDVNREDISLRSIVPRKKGRAYNPWAIIISVVDQESWFEIGALWGRTAIVGLARLGGRPVGILSLNCEVNSGALDPGGSQKMMKMLKFCDVFNLPILQFVDVRK